jgi:hypothetical protein
METNISSSTDGVSIVTVISESRSVQSIGISAVTSLTDLDVHVMEKKKEKKKKNVK